MSNEGTSEAQAVAALQGFIYEQIKLGKEKPQITEALKDQGMEADAAQQAVDALHPQIIAAMESQQVTPKALIPAVLGGLLGAIVGGAVWAAIVVGTGYEVGYIAVGVGFLCGWGVVFLSGGKRGPALQVIAVVCSLLGILIGKYAAFYFLLKQELGAAADSLSPFGGEVINMFSQNISVFFGGFDILWVIFAIGAAWRMPQAD